VTPFGLALLSGVLTSWATYQAVRSRRRLLQKLQDGDPTGMERAQLVKTLVGVTFMLLATVFWLTLGVAQLLKS